jgi:mono/diheme cytochrome c family protein
MQKNFKNFALFVFFFTAAMIFVVGAKANFRQANSFAKADQKVSAKDLYNRNCARCHGADGKGQTDLGQKLDVPDLSISGRRMSVAKITGVITNGKGDMPAYGKKLTKTQIKSIAAYVRKL